MTDHIDALVREIGQIPRYKDEIHSLTLKVRGLERELEWRRSDKRQKTWNVIHLTGVVVQVEDASFVLGEDESDYSYHVEMNHSGRIKAGQLVRVIGKLLVQQEWEGPTSLLIQPYFLEILSQGGGEGIAESAGAPPFPGEGRTIEIQAESETGLET